MAATALFDTLGLDPDVWLGFDYPSDASVLNAGVEGTPRDLVAVARDAGPELEADTEASGDVAVGLDSITQLGDDLLQTLDSFSAVSEPATIATPNRSSRPPSALKLSGAIIVRNHGARSAAEVRAKQRKERHSTRERRRIHAAADRVREMRYQVAALEYQRAQLSASFSRACMQDIRASLNQGCGVPSESVYLELVAAVDSLRKEKTYLKERIDVYDAQYSVVQGFLTEVSLEIDGQPVVAAAAAEDHSITWADATPTYLKVLFKTPLTMDQAFGWVKRSYDEIMALKNRSRFESSGSSTFNWSDRRVVQQDSLEFMFGQDFRGALASEFVSKTWSLLTVLKNYTLIQPRARGLRVLQRINDDCVVVRLSVANTQDDVFHTVMVVARGRINNGYLISYRSIPLSEGQMHFVDGEGTYVSVFNWFMFIDKFDVDDRPVCEVIFGGCVANRSARYLRYLTMEVVAGIVRWQTAVGQSRLNLSL